VERRARTKPFDRADAVDQGQTLSEELVSSVALIGGVIALLVLVVQFAG
jgi:hypothetical protein